MTGSRLVLALKTSGICGVASPMVGFLSIFLAISYSLGFSWVQNWLSDLGGTTVSPFFPERPLISTSTTEIIFNTGLIMSGIFALIFALGLRKSIVSPSGRIGTLALIFGSVSLCCVGIFPEPTGYAHVLATVAFFLLTPIGMFFIGASAVDTNNRRLGYVVSILGFIAILFGVVLIQFGAIPEIISNTAISLFLIVFGVKLFREAPNPMMKH